MQRGHDPSGAKGGIERGGKYCGGPCPSWTRANWDEPGVGKVLHRGEIAKGEDHRGRGAMENIKTEKKSRKILKTRRSFNETEFAKRKWGLNKASSENEHTTEGGVVSGRTHE